MNIDKRNAEHYSDPTAYAAMMAIEREGRCPPVWKWPFVYICSPFAGDTSANVEKALSYCRFALDKGKFPIAPHCYLPRFMNDENPAERELALAFGLRLLSECRELWIFGDHISVGMRREVSHARKRGIRLRSSALSPPKVNAGDRRGFKRDAMPLMPSVHCQNRCPFGRNRIFCGI